ncbi:uncharacterized protein G6M90_00g111620 [Metarhizium brunneum]|uniref:Uncharacterized protein n=1 Tax=Metarhizium brunneum TaxID=500148 RepID=A0A7D5V4E6_9HYPO|nr:hypothetical protein G6M90_00g111620 [Metarhizium brunneum]
MRDYLNKEKDDHEEETNTIFESYNEFEKAIKKAFRTVDKARAAEYYINGLKQKGLEDEPLMSAFYKGLKEEVKDELYRENKPDNLLDYIAMAKIEVTESEVEHKNLNWTFCYDDNCYVYISTLQTGIRTTISNKKIKAKIRKVIATLRKDLANTNKKLEGEKRNKNDKDDKSPITKEERLKNIPKKYRKYEKLFAEELETGLPEHSQ